MASRFCGICLVIWNVGLRASDLGFTDFGCRLDIVSIQQRLDT